GLRVHDRPAAQREHPGVFGEGGAYRSCFELTEPGFAVLDENVRYRLARLRLDDLIGVGEGQVEEFRQAAPDAGFSCPRWADEHDVGFHFRFSGMFST